VRDSQRIRRLQAGLLHVAAALLHEKTRSDGCRSEGLTSNAMYLCSRASCGESISPWLEAGGQLVQTPQMQKDVAVQEVAGDVRVDRVEGLQRRKGVSE